VWRLRDDGHEAVVGLPAVPGVGAERVLSVDGELRHSLVYRAYVQAELSAAMAYTPASPTSGGPSAAHEMYARLIARK
jgi:hypothetical protein